VDIAKKGGTWTDVEQKEKWDQTENSRKNKRRNAATWRVNKKRQERTKRSRGLTEGGRRSLETAGGSGVGRTNKNVPKQYLTEREQLKSGKYVRGVKEGETPRLQVSVIFLDQGGA